MTDQTPTTSSITDTSTPPIAEVHNALYPASAAGADGGAPAPAEGAPGGDPPPADGAGGSGVPSPVEPPVAKEGDTLLAKAEDGEPAPAPAAVDPTSYTDFTLPEGFTPSADLMTDFRTEAAALSLDQAGAQRLVDLHIKAQSALTSAIAEEQTALQAQWLTESNALPELSGPTRGTTVTAMGRVMDEYGTPALKEFLIQTGLGNHPELVRMVARVSLALSEPGPTTPGRAVNQTTSRKGVNALYGPSN